MAQMVPSVHLNGTSADELIRQHCEAARFIIAAIKAVEASAPNGRDYYTQPDGAYEQAKREHDARVAALLAVQREHEAIAYAVRLRKRPR